MICSLTIGVMFQTGGRTLAAVALGSGDVDKAERYLSKALSAAFILGTIFSILLWLVSRPALRLFGASGASMPQAEAYVDWILVSCPGQAVAMTLVAALSAEGRPKACFLLSSPAPSSTQPSRRCSSSRSAGASRARASPWPSPRARASSSLSRLSWARRAASVRGPVISSPRRASSRTSCGSACRWPSCSS